MKSIDIFSPAGDLGSGFGPSGSGGAGSLTIHPQIAMTDSSGDTPNGSKPCEEFAGIGPTPGSTPCVNLATGAPESYNDGALGETLVGGLGNPPRP